MTTTTTTADPVLPVSEDAVVESVDAVAPLGALLDAVPMCTLVVRGVERGPAHRPHDGMRTTVTD